jgi:hypothetical protein
MISKVCGDGKGTVWGASVASLEGLSGATEDFGSGVAAVGDLEAIVDRNPANPGQDRKPDKRESARRKPVQA